MSAGWGLFRGEQPDRWEQLKVEDIDRLPREAQEGLGQGRPWGVVRTTHPGVKYDKPELGGALPEWHHTGIATTGQSRLVMLFDQTDDPKPTSLATFIKALWHKRRGSTRPNKALAHDLPELDKLDWVIVALLDATAVLHQHDKGLGWLTPENVLWYERDGRPRLVLPDIGHSCPEGGVTPGEVAAAARTHGALWGHDAPGQTVARPFDKAADLALLARLFDWVMCEQARAEPPREDERTRHEVYEVLRQARKGGYREAAELKAALLVRGEEKTTLVSAFFTHGGTVRRARPSRVKRWVGISVALTLLAAVTVGGVLAYQDYMSRQTNSNGTRSEVAAVRPRPELVAALDKYKTTRPKPPPPKPKPTSDPVADQANQQDHERADLEAVWRTLAPQLAALEVANRLVATAAGEQREVEETLLVDQCARLRRDFERVGDRLPFLTDDLPEDQACRQLREIAELCKRAEALPGHKETPKWKSWKDKLANLVWARPCR